MKKMILVAMILLISGCVVGEFEPKREKLHSKGKNICQTNPERCFNGQPW
ncbi:MAG: hypothetical protein R3Y43_01085 [Alphaproteobacteria bacterium]